MSKLKIEIRSNNKGCNPIGHFRRNWMQNEKLPESFKDIEVEYLENQLEDTLVITKGVEVLKVLKHSDSLRLDIVNDIFKKEYGIN